MMTADEGGVLRLNEKKIHITLYHFFSDSIYIYIYINFSFSQFTQAQAHIHTHNFFF